MDESFPAKATADQFFIAFSFVMTTVSLIIVLDRGGSDIGFVSVVCSAAVVIYVATYVLFRCYVRGKHCVFNDDGLSMGRMFFMQRIPYSAITKIGSQSDKIAGGDDRGSLWIFYRKTAKDIWLFGFVPLMVSMSIENKDRVLEILKEKCNETVFN